MPDDPDLPSHDSDESPQTGEPRGYLVYLAIALLAILVFLVFFMNPLERGSTPSIVITETPWSLSSLAGPDNVMTPLLNGTVITAQFSPDGKLTGSTGCNAYSARYMVYQTGIVVSRVTAASIPCTEGNASVQELRFIAATENAAYLRTSDRELTFFGTDGKPLLVFTPARSGI
jgi:heat shock protein HslJ